MNTNLGLSSSTILIAVIVILFILIIAIVVAVYNALIKLRVRVDEAWSDITVQLKRRADLIPNLVETVKGYASHESRVFEDVTKARAAVMTAASQGPKATAQAEGQFESALKSLFAVAEAYPELKASDNFRALQDEITDTEDKVQAARRFYNSGVRDLNTKIQTFPNNLIASMFNFKQREFFEVEDRAAVEEAPQVKF